MYRDVRYVLPFIMQLWLFASPVAYSASLIQSPLARAVYALNPIVGLIDAARATVLGTPLRPATLAVSCLSTLVLLIGGVVIFQRLERRFADVI